jgi:hypothetical protein
MALRFVAVLLVIVGIVATSAAAAAPAIDTEAPAILAPLVGTAKDLAREKAGPLGLFGLRLAAAGCSPGARSGAFMFEDRFSLVRTYALVAFPPPAEVDQPGATTTIVALTEAEFGADGDPSWLSDPCR